MAYGRPRKDLRTPFLTLKFSWPICRQGDYRQRTLGFKYNFVGRNASYKKVTLTFCIAEQIEVADVQQVKCA